MSQFCVKMCPGLVNIYRRDMCQICFDQKWIFVRKFHSVVNTVKSLKVGILIQTEKSEPKITETRGQNGKKS